MRTWIGFLLAGIVMLPAPSLAGEKGAVEGVFLLAGKAPAESPGRIPERGGACAGKELPSAYEISKDGGVANVAVWIEGASASPGLPKRDIVMSNGSCRVSPRVAVGLVGSDFVFKTDGERMHNFHLYLQWKEHDKLSQRPLRMGATVYNVAFPKGDHEVRKPIKAFHKTREETGIIKVKCNLHPWEEATLLVFDHPYTAVTDGEGKFSLRDVPPGKYTLKWWHDGFGAGQKMVEVKGVVTERIELKAM
ncbi:MAG: hypothetical protein A2V83_11385 [Nitrospirae bacterium RBG_16_64_22]|nr:MAG: hypothetical protein A2V83_11385 [Nitrospirae bacterium RBG_16_64_22]